MTRFRAGFLLPVTINLNLFLTIFHLWFKFILLSIYTFGLIISSKQRKAPALREQPEA